MSVTEDPTIAGRYLADQLTEADRAGYEALLLESPEAVAELEATARLKVGLEKLRETDELDRLLHVPSRAKWKRFLLLAASLAVFATGLGLWLSNYEHAHSRLLFAASLASLTNNAGRTLQIASTVPVYRKRSGPFDAVLEVPPLPAGVEFRLLAQPPAAAHAYRVSISRMLNDKSFESVDTLVDLQSENDGFIRLYADASRLIPGQYRLVLEEQLGDDRHGSPQTLLINVVANPKSSELHF
jgi:hypothetical protein